MPSIAETIRTLRGKRSQEDCALQIGTTQKSWSRWETGTRKPSAQSAVKLSKLFKVSLGAFIDGGG